MSIVGCILLKGSDRLQGSCAAEAPWSIVAPQCLRTSPTFSAACTGKMCGLIHAHLRVHCSHKFEIWAIGNEHIESHMASGCNRFGFDHVRRVWKASIADLSQQWFAVRPRLRRKLSRVFSMCSFMSTGSGKTRKNRQV